jgi:arylsulfatase A-like enzyme
MPPEEVTLAEYLKEKGYSTGHFGKWHLGTLTNDIIDANLGGRNPDHYSPPWENGFDVCFSTESRVPTWDPMITPDSTAGWLADLTPGEPFGTYYWSGPGKIVTDNLSGSNARIIMDRVIPFIEEQAAEKKPFFTVVWFHSPHQPVVAGEEYLNMYDEYSHGEQHYYGVISAMDEQIGRLNRKLKELNSERNTLIFFTSDNGPEGKVIQAIDQGSTGGFRGRKRSLYEGGIRVPCIVVWPDKIKGGRQTDFPGVTSDYFPTILDILGEKGQFPVSPIDGISLVDVWKDELKDRPFPIGFQSQNQKALIDNRYKLVQVSETFELYDLLDDPFETTDIANENAEIVREMKSELNDFIHSCEESFKGADYD